jgi:hypothetical protein
VRAEHSRKTNTEGVCAPGPIARRRGIAARRARHITHAQPTTSLPSKRLRCSQQNPSATFCDPGGMEEQLCHALTPDGHSVGSLRALPDG